MFIATISKCWIIFCSGDNMNTFMNENWKELVRDLAPPVGDAIGLVVEMILTNMFERIPFDEVFPETVQKAWPTKLHT